MTQKCYGALIENRGIDSPAVRMESRHAEKLTAALVRTLYDDPLVRYILPDERERRRVFPGLMFNAIQAGQQNGEIYITPDADGGAVWIGPHSVRSHENLRRLFPQSLPWSGSSLRRSVRLGVHLARVHQQLVSREHWYLLALGAEPSRNEILGKLLEPILKRAEATGLPCYLETFSEKTLPLFERCGFRIAAAGRVPNSGPDFWAMLRTSRG